MSFTKERLRITFTANGRNDHVTMFFLHLPLAVFSFSVKMISFALATKARIILHYSHLRTHFFKKTVTGISRFSFRFAVNAILNLSHVSTLLPTFTRYDVLPLGKAKRMIWGGGEGRARESPSELPFKSDRKKDQTNIIW